SGPQVAPCGHRERSRAPAGRRLRERTPMIFAIALAAAVAAAPSAARQGAQALAQPRRDSALLHRGADSAVQAKEQEQERALRSLLALGGSEAEQAEVTARLANLMRGRGLALTGRAVGEHLFDKAKLADALLEYRAAAEVETDDVYPYALYKAAWCRFNQNAFGDAMKLLHKVVAVSLGGDPARPSDRNDANKVQLARE